MRFFWQLLCCWILIFSVFCSARAELSDAERHTKAKELEQLRGRIADIMGQRKAVRSRYDEVQTALRQTERAIGEQRRELGVIHGKLGRQNKKLDQLQLQQAQLNKKVSRQRSLLAQQIRTAYMIGRQEYLKLLLNQEDPAALGRTMTYYDYFNRARQKQIGQAQATLQQLDTVKLEIDAHKRELLALKDSQSAQQKVLEKKRRQRRGIVAQLAQEMKNQDAALEHLRDDEQQLKSLLEAIEDILTAPDNHRKFAAYRGQLAWPVKGRIRNMYGRQRHKSRVKWNGILIEAREGVAVHAVARGRIAYADWLRGYGLLVILDHGDGYMSLYGYNQSLQKEVGDWVEANEQIATVGLSGGQQKSALYFEIRHNGHPANPNQWCARTRHTG